MPPSQTNVDDIATGRSKTTPRKRTRSGCLPCRSRRRKCDGARPRCRNCESRGHICQWGLKASFHHSRNLSLFHHEAAALTAPRRIHGLLTIIDESEDIARSYGGPLPEYRSPPISVSASISEPSRGQAEPPIDREEEAANSSSSEVSYEHPQNHSAPCGLSVDDLLSQPISQPQNIPIPTLADWGFSPLADSPPAGSFTGGSAPGSRAGPGQATYIPPFSLGQAVSEDVFPPPDPPDPPLSVTNAEKANLISAYMRETGTWCETTDSDMHFTMRSVHKMMESPAFAAAAMALASRQLGHIEPRQRPATLELYQYTIQLLLRQDPAHADASVLATCTLLCVYEMMASGVDEWRRHLKGCAGLLRAQRWNGSSSGIVKACFWAFARIDVWAAFSSGKTTLIPTDFWVDDMSIESVAAKGSIDDYCNLAILIFARIANLLAASSHGRGGFRSAMAAPVSTLWHELQNWRRFRPQKVHSLLREDACPPSRVFPTILLSRSSSICGNTFYHAGSVLLLQTGLLTVAELSLPSPSENVGSIVWHARELAGISTSNSSHANWVNHLQPLYIAGTAFVGKNPAVETTPGIFSENQLRRFYPSPPRDGSGSGSHGLIEFSGEGPEEEYPAEKILLLKHLARIERETGWKTSDRAADLRMLWGFG